MAQGAGFTDRYLGDDEAARIVQEGLDSLPLDARRLLVIIPDSTRTMPMALMFDLIERAAGGRVAALDYLVALGTHQPLSDAQLGKLLGRDVVGGCTGRS